MQTIQINQYRIQGSSLSLVMVLQLQLEELYHCAGSQARKRLITYAFDNRVAVPPSATLCIIECCPLVTPPPHTWMYDTTMTTVLQWRLEQPTVLLFAACWLSLGTRGAITGPTAILRATPRRASPGGTCHRGSHLHDAVGEPTRTSFAWGVPRRAPRGIYTCEFSQSRYSLILWNLQVPYSLPKTLLLDTVMSQLNTVHGFTRCFFKGYNMGVSPSA